MISSGVIFMKGVLKMVMVVGKLGIGIGVFGKLIVVVMGCGGMRILLKGKCSVILIVGGRGDGSFVGIRIGVFNMVVLLRKLFNVWVGVLISVFIVFR